MTLYELKQELNDLPSSWNDLEVYLPDQEYGPYSIKLRTILPCIFKDSQGGPPIFIEEYSNPIALQVV